MYMYTKLPWSKNRSPGSQNKSNSVLCCGCCLSVRGAGSVQNLSPVCLWCCLSVRGAWSVQNLSPVCLWCWVCAEPLSCLSVVLGLFRTSLLLGSRESRAGRQRQRRL